MARPGERNRRIVVEEDKTTAASTTGGHVPDWATYCKRWAKIAPLGGSEDESGERIHGTRRLRMELAYDTDTAGITHKMRVVRGTRTFEILSVIDPDEAHREIHLITEEQVT